MSDIREKYVEIGSGTGSLTFPADRPVFKLTDCRNFNQEPAVVVIPHPDVARELIVSLMLFISAAEECPQTDGS